MAMNQPLRRVTLTVHIACSVGWLGAIAAYITLNIPALAGSNEQTMRAAYLTMLPVAWYAIVPLAIATLLTGIVLALGTPWGLFRHYWVLYSPIITTVAVAILLGHMEAVTATARLAGDPSADISGLTGDLDHSIGGLLVLLAPLVLNIYKPRGLTRHGRRKQQVSARSPADRHHAEPTQSRLSTATRHSTP
jgi:hypothetical protein